MDRETASGSGTADGTQALPEWRAYAGEFPRWHVWRGVGGHYYGRIRRTSPPLVLRAPSVEDLRDEIFRAELSGWPVPSWQHVKDRCA